MAVTQRPRAVPKTPKLEEIDQADVRDSYDRLADTLVVSLTRPPRPAYNVYVDDDTVPRVDSSTDEVVGLEIERSLEHALRHSGGLDPAGTEGLRPASTGSPDPGAAPARLRLGAGNRRPDRRARDRAPATTWPLSGQRRAPPRPRG